MSSDPSNTVPANSLHPDRNEKAYRCTTAGCNKRFDLDYRLKEHVKRKHTKPLVCDIPGCSYRSGSRYSMSRHQRGHDQRGNGSTLPFDESNDSTLPFDESAAPNPAPHDQTPSTELASFDAESVSPSAPPTNLLDGRSTDACEATEERMADTTRPFSLHEVLTDDAADDFAEPLCPRGCHCWDCLCISQLFPGL